ncbi:S8/S53 family peptidase [Aliikangiella sp. IMCC44653]
MKSQFKIINDFYLVFVYFVVSLALAGCTLTQLTSSQSNSISQPNLISASEPNKSYAALKNFTIIESNQEFAYIDFNEKLDLQSLYTNNQPNNKLSRNDIQQLAKKLSAESVNLFLNQASDINGRAIKQVQPVIINNAAIVYFTDNSKLNSDFLQQPSFLSSDNTGRFRSNKIQVALIDSGVSQHHQDFQNLTITQYNPRQLSWDKVDTGLGHGSGVLSVFLQTLQSQNIQPDQFDYLVCNGLEQGQYIEPYLLQCLDWLFLSSTPSIIINAWLVNQPGCNDRLSYPLGMLWLSNSVTFFAAGNYANSDNMNYAPANLPPLFGKVPLVTVGALNNKKQRLPSSSFGRSICGDGSNQSMFYETAQDLKAAVPFGFSSYQVVSGTSYAVAKAAAKFALLKLEFSLISNQKILNVILETANRLTLDADEKPALKIDLKAARKALAKMNN